MSKAVEEAVVEVEIDAMELLTALVDEHKASFAASNPACKRAFEERGAAGLPGGTNRPSIYFEPFPLTFVGSKGGHLTTADGKELVDMQGNMTAGLFGHNEVVKQAVKDVMDAGWSLGGHNENEAKVAAEFTQRFPCCDMVKFCNTGTEATTYAINTARAVSGKPKVLMYVGGYHGAYIHGTPNDSSPLEIPYEKVLVEYSPDPAAITAAIHEHASELACVLIEPVVMSRFAYLKSLAPTSYLQAVRDTCTACGVALIFDEVMTSRLAPGGAQELAGVTPDMMTCGKYFAGGLNFGAFGGTEAWMARHDPLHPETIASGGTFNQNAVSMAAAAAVLQHVWTPEICREHNAKGDLLRARINELAAAHNAPCDAHGTGSLINVVFRSLPLFEADGHTMTEDWKTEGLSSALVSSLFFFFMLEKGFLVGTPGLTYLTLPTALTDEDYDGFMVAFESFMIEMEEPLGLLDSLAQSSPMAMATMTHGHAGGGANERRLGRASL